MRITAPLLKTLHKTSTAASTASSVSSSSPSVSTAWLSSLKAAQLQRVAFLTGTSATGTKSVLVERLSRRLQDYNADGPADSNGRMSILSIDMGIRNLAYAHLIVSPSSPSLSKGKRKKEALDKQRGVVLNAWNRLAISSMDRMEMTPGGLESALENFNGCETTTSKNKRKSKRARPASSPSSNEEGENATCSTSKETEKESFAPDLYASHAYTLITSLVAAYKPTHILIERQRFRSGGGSAVLEWTIRVGVFEGMLYSVLQTLKGESRRRRQGDGVEDISVLGVDPQRVARYWLEKIVRPEEGNMQQGKGKMSSKEGKKAKIDVVGSLLLAEKAQSSDTSFRPAELTKSGVIDADSIRVHVGASKQAHEIVNAFLDKWNQSIGRRRVNSPLSAETDSCLDKKAKKKQKTPKGKTEENVSNEVIEVGKLDDLADCLLQGLTWLAWRDMQARIARDGMDAIPFD